MTYIVLILILISCKREILINIDNKPSVLVVDAALYHDSLMKIELSQTQNITDNGLKKTVENATIEVYNKDSVIIDVLNHSGAGIYKSNFLKPVSGATYHFNINSGGKNYWVTEQMPDTPECIIQDTGRIIFQGKMNFFQFNLKLTDPVAVRNFYGLRLKRYFKEFDGIDTVSKEEWVKLESIDFILTEDPQSRFSNQHLLFKDIYMDGQVKFLKFGASDLFSKSNQKTTSLKLFVSSYSENAYNFYTSVNEHIFYQNDPFSQPTLIRGNIPGAYGAIVGQYTVVFDLGF